MDARDVDDAQPPLASLPAMVVDLSPIPAYKESHHDEDLSRPYYSYSYPSSNVTSSVGLSVIEYETEAEFLDRLSAPKPSSVAVTKARKAQQQQQPATTSSSSFYLPICDHGIGEEKELRSVPQINEYSVLLAEIYRARKEANRGTVAVGPTRLHSPARRHSSSAADPKGKVSKTSRSKLPTESGLKGKADSNNAEEKKKATSMPKALYERGKDWQAKREQALATARAAKKRIEEEEIERLQSTIVSEETKLNVSDFVSRQSKWKHEKEQRLALELEKEKWEDGIDVLLGLDPTGSEAWMRCCLSNPHVLYGTTSVQWSDSDFYMGVM